MAGLFIHECAVYFADALRQTPDPSSFFPWTSSAWSAWGRHILRAGGAACLLGGMWAAGAALWRWISRVFPTDPLLAGSERFFAQTALGIAACGLAGFLAAVLGMSRPWLLRALSGLFLAAALWNVRRWKIGALRFRVPPGERILWAGLSALGLLYFVATMTPETFGDVLHYVLAEPEAFLREGRWTVLEGNSNAGYPGLARMFYLWGLAWGDDRFCKLLNLGVGVLWVSSVGLWTARRWGRAAGLWAALLLGSVPLTGLYVWSATADVLCGFLAFCAFAVWAAAPDEGKERGSAVFLAGFLLGAAAAAKYTAAAAIPYFVLDALRRRRAPGFIRSAALFCGGFLLPLLPWWAVDAAAYGNPFHPYAASWLGRISGEQLEMLEMMLADQRGDPSFLSRLSGLWVSSLKGIWQGRSGFVGPTLLLLVPFSPLLARRDRKSAASVGLYCAAGYAAFAWTTGRVRFILPLLGVFMAGAGAVAAGAMERLGRWRAVLAVPLGAAAAVQGLCLLGVFGLFHEGFEVVSGRDSAEAFLRRPHGSSYSAPLQAAFERLRREPPGSRVYILGDARAFRCPVRWYANTMYDTPLYARWMNEGTAPSEFPRRLAAEGFTHVLVNVPGLGAGIAGRYRSPLWAERLERALAALGPPVYRDEWTALFRVPSIPGDG